jgi:hypothetical protein
MSSADILFSFNKSNQIIFRARTKFFCLRRRDDNHARGFVDVTTMIFFDLTSWYVFLLKELIAVDK